MPFCQGTATRSPSHPNLCALSPAYRFHRAAEASKRVRLISIPNLIGECNAFHYMGKGTDGILTKKFQCAR
jgi:hypothetical protein